MRIGARSALLTAQDVDLGGVVALQELKLTCTGVEFETQPGGTVMISHAEATLIITEASVNALLRRYPPESSRDLEIATLSGKVRISGKWLVNGVPVPFDLTGQPEVEGGARIRLNVQQVRALGALVLPSFVTQGIANRLNEALARGFDVTRLPWVLRLTAVKVEPGRIQLSANASIELRAAPRAEPDEPAQVEEKQRLTDDAAGVYKG